jgi:putative Mg2+ transporter-C (MgtC) family protein
LTEYFQEKNIVIEDVNFDVKFMEDYRIYTNIYTIDLPRGLGFSEVIEELSVYKNVTKIRLVDIA